MKTLILGLGNTILCDDGIGIYTVRKINQLYQHDNLTVLESEIGGFSLVDCLDGYDLAVIIDAIHEPSAPPGTVKWYDFNRNYTFPTSHLVSGHQIDLVSAVKLGRELGASFPDTIFIIGIVIENDTTFGESCSDRVQESIEPAARLAIDMITFPAKYTSPEDEKSSITS